MTFVQTEEGGRFDVGYNAMHYFKREREREGKSILTDGGLDFLRL